MKRLINSLVTWYRKVFHTPNAIQGRTNQSVDGSKVMAAVGTVFGMGPEEHIFINITEDTYKEFVDGIVRSFRPEILIKIMDIVRKDYPELTTKVVEYAQEQSKKQQIGANGHSSDVPNMGKQEVPAIAYDCNKGYPQSIKFFIG